MIEQALHAEQNECVITNDIRLTQYSHGAG